MIYLNYKTEIIADRIIFIQEKIVREAGRQMYSILVISSS